jgi:hypothetical protein
VFSPACRRGLLSVCFWVSMYDGFRVWYALGLVGALPLMGSLGLCGGHVGVGSCGG